MQLSTYLTFNGNCREAMTFYQQCLGGELSFQTVGESPLTGQLPDQIKKYIVHATLTKNEMVLMASDMVSERGLMQGNNVAMLLQCDSEAEAQRIYKNLSEGSEQTQPLELTCWGVLFGNLTDKFGNHWLLQYQQLYSQ